MSPNLLSLDQLAPRYGRYVIARLLGIPDPQTPMPYRPGLPFQGVMADQTYYWSDPNWKNPYIPPFVASHV